MAFNRDYQGITKIVKLLAGAQAISRVECQMQDSGRRSLTCTKPATPPPALVPICSRSVSSFVFLFCLLVPCQRVRLRLGRRQRRPLSLYSISGWQANPRGFHLLLKGIRPKSRENRLSTKYRKQPCGVLGIHAEGQIGFSYQTILPLFFGHFFVTLAGHFLGFVLVIEPENQAPIPPPQHFVFPSLHPFG